LERELPQSLKTAQLRLQRLPNQRVVE